MKSSYYSCLIYKPLTCLSCENLRFPSELPSFIMNKDLGFVDSKYFNGIRSDGQKVDSCPVLPAVVHIWILCQRSH